MAIVNLISADSRIRVGGDPYARKVVGVNPIFNELALTRFMHVNAPRLPVVNFTAYHRRVRSSYNYSIRSHVRFFSLQKRNFQPLLLTFHFEASNPVVVDIVTLEISQSIVESEDADVSAVVDMIATHDGVCVILHPDTCQRVAADFVVLIKTLSMVGDVKANVFAVRYVTTTNYGFRTSPSDTPDCNNKERLVNSQGDITGR
jgi:hypothetical protein